MDLDRIPWRVRDALEDLGYSPEEMMQMSPKEMFAEFCNWEGLINYGNTLWTIMEVLNEAQKCSACNCGGWVKASKGAHPFELCPCKVS